jgi:hypothetical protein
LGHSQSCACVSCLTGYLKPTIVAYDSPKTFPEKGRCPNGSWKLKKVVAVHPSDSLESGWAKIQKGGTAVKESYRIWGPNDSKKLAVYLAKDHQILMPMVELIEASRLAVDELIDVLGRASIEAVLQLSAINVAGEKHRGRRGGAVGWHGSQPGTVRLSDRKLRVSKPRLRRKGRGARGPRWRFPPMRLSMPACG